MSLTVFKIVSFMALLVFTVYISDFRNKKGMVLLVNKKWIFILKIFYFIPIFIYLYVLIRLENIFIYTYFGLLLTFVGALVVLKAKADLGKYHTWAGHLLCSTKMVTKGIYAFIRHPIYTGIYLFIIGAITLSINNHPFSFYSATMIIIFVIFIAIFLAMASLKENKFLEEKFGDAFITYKKQVHSFLPLRKYSFEK